MANEISTFDLEVLSKKYDVRIWLCEKTGRRWSFVVGAGAQRALPSELVLSDEKHGFFVQGEDYVKEALVQDLIDLCLKNDLMIA
jgi:hypothetical protein